MKMHPTQTAKVNSYFIKNTQGNIMYFMERKIRAYISDYTNT